MGPVRSVGVEVIFLSTPSARRATPVRADLGVGDQNFYPRPLRGGRRGDRFLLRHTAGISIHALCEEGD